MRRLLLGAAVLTALPAMAHAQLVNLGPGSFTPLAPVITFDDFGSINPTYDFTDIPGLGDVTVSFAGAFMGQTVTGGAVRTLTGTPTGPLTLNTGVITRVTSDGANPTSPVLSGDPTFNGPISILFSQPVAGVGLSGGFFDAIGGTTIAAFGSDGTFLGSITNSQTGIEFYGLATASGENEIAGISFYITGSEPAGFAIDNVTFGSVDVIVPPSVVPEPSSVILLASGLLGLGGIGMRRRRQRSGAAA
ncbi:MAG TPA: PEP-CTERM sorting domain-containing protein [Gemmatimonadales bacterium]